MNLGEVRAEVLQLILGAEGADKTGAYINGHNDAINKVLKLLKELQDLYED